MPAPFPALLTVDRVVSAQSLVSFRGNRYSVPPNLHGATVSVTIRLDDTHLDIATTPGSSLGSSRAPLPTVITRHRLAPTGAGVMVRDHGHVTALNQAAMNAATTASPHRGKQRLPPTPAARAEAAALRTSAGTGTDDVVVDLAQYAAAAAGRNTLRTDDGLGPMEGETVTTPNKTTRPSKSKTIKENTRP